MKDNAILAIGYGNTLRSDDGAGQVVAEAVGSWELPKVRSLAVHQLTPELAEDLASVEFAIFIDAYPATEAEEVVKLELIEIGKTDTIMAHSLNPRSLLALSQELYGHSPTSWWVLVPAVNFEFGEALSPVTAGAVTEALQQIRLLIQSTHSNITFPPDL